MEFMVHDISIHKMSQERATQFINQMAVELFAFSVMDAKDLTVDNDNRDIPQKIQKKI